MKLDDHGNVVRLVVLGFKGEDVATISASRNADALEERLQRVSGSPDGYEAELESLPTEKEEIEHARAVIKENEVVMPVDSWLLRSLWTEITDELIEEQRQHVEALKAGQLCMFDVERWRLVDGEKVRVKEWCGEPIIRRGPGRVPTRCPEHTDVDRKRRERRRKAP